MNTQILESIGPSCSGKTTLINRCYAMLRDLTVSSSLPARIVRRRDLGIPDPCQASLDHPSSECLRVLLPGVQVSDYFSPCVNYSLRITLRILLENTILRQRACRDSRDFFLLDSGVCKVFHRELARLPKGVLSEILAGRALLFHSVRHPETLYPRIEERRAKGDPVTAYKGMSKAAIYSVIQRKVRKLEAFSAFCEKQGSPVLRTYAEDPLEASCKYVIDFVMRSCDKLSNDARAD